MVATVGLRPPAEPADNLDADLVAALLAVREARERLRRVDAVLARIVATLTPAQGGEP